MWEHWFAGLSDGEATFHIERNGQPRFQIALRDDDIEVLLECQKKLGGKVRTYSTKKGAMYSQWTVAGDECVSIVQVLSGRMRSKKAKDCAIWCEAVVRRSELPRMSRKRKPLMLEFKEKLEAQRRAYKEGKA